MYVLIWLLVMLALCDFIQKMEDKSLILFLSSSCPIFSFKEISPWTRGATGRTSQTSPREYKRHGPSQSVGNARYRFPIQDVKWSWGKKILIMTDIFNYCSEECFCFSCRVGAYHTICGFRCFHLELLTLFNSYKVYQHIEYIMIWWLCTDWICRNMCIRIYRCLFMI